MPQYTDLHVFIDESGDFIDHIGAEALLLGGVFFWGDYSTQKDGLIRVKLLHALHDCYDYEYRCVDYSHLHYHYEARLRGVGRDQYWDEKTRFIEESRASLAAGDDYDRLEGFVMRFEDDVFDSSEDARVSESFLDNRYERMLELLIECVLQRALWNGYKRLDPEGAIHFHIASRTTVLRYQGDAERERIIAEQLEPLGITKGDEPGQYVVVPEGSLIAVQNILDIGRLYEVFNQSLERIGQNSTCRAEFQIEKIKYPNFTYVAANNPSFFIPDRDVDLSPACYYLADLFLGQVRNRQPEDALIVPFDPTTNSWAYVTATKFINELQILLARRSSEEFWRAIVRQPENVSERVFTEFLASLSPDRAQLILSGFNSALTRVRDDVDKPGLGELVRFKKVYDAFTLIYNALLQYNTTYEADAMTDALELTKYRVQITLANHLGRSLEGRELVKSYNEFVSARDRDVFASFLPEEELEYRTDMALRCAVTQVDQFDYSGASRLVEEVLELQERTFSFFNQLASSSRLRPRASRLSLGRCYGALGQYKAFQGEGAAAMELLNRAISYIDAHAFPGDIERDLIYLGHVLCDLARDAEADEDVVRVEALWRELVERWNSFFPTQSLPAWNDLDAMERLADGNRYTFALLVKAIAYFGTDADIRGFLNRWEGSALYKRIESSDSRDSFEHPYELICQAIGALYESQYDDSTLPESVRDQCKARALKFYEYGYQISRHGGELIQILGLASRARARLLARANAEEWRVWNAALERLLAKFDPEGIGAVFGHDRPLASPDAELAELDVYRDKAKSFIRAIRFNYW